MQQFCFQFTIKTGCLFVAYATGIFSGLCCIGSILRLLLGVPVVLQNDDYQGQFPFNPLFYVFGAIFFAVHTVASFALIPAVKLNLRIYMIPVFVLLIIDTVLSIIIMVALSVISVKTTSLKKYFIGGVIIAAFVSLSSIYFLLLLRSYYRYLSQNTDEELLKHVQEAKKFGQKQVENSSDESMFSSGPTTV